MLFTSDLNPVDYDFSRLSHAWHLLMFIKQGGRNNSFHRHWCIRQKSLLLKELVAGTGKFSGISPVAVYHSPRGGVPVGTEPQAQLNEIEIMRVFNLYAPSVVGGLALVAALMASSTYTVDAAALTAPVKSVYGDYLKIQVSLANDSLAGVTQNAEAIAKAVRTDAKTLPTAVATEADALARVSDLRSARAAFKPLSDSLIRYLADHKVKGGYVQVYCPMARASWLQADKNVNNPYLGKEMPTCGEIK
jgi:hypothetical protein